MRNEVSGNDEVRLMKDAVIISVLVMAIAGGVFYFHGGFIKAKNTSPNRGSALLALTSARDAIATYKRSCGEYPFAQDISVLYQFGLSEASSGILKMLNNANLQSSLTDDIVVVVCEDPVQMESGETGRYVLKLSGDILLVPERQAQLGSRVERSNPVVVDPEP